MITKEKTTELGFPKAGKPSYLNDLLLEEKIYEIIKETHKPEYWDGANKYNRDEIMRGIVRKILEVVEQSTK